MVLAIGVGYWIAVRAGSSRPPFWLVGLPLVMIAFGLRLALRRTRQWFNTFEIELNGDQITRRQAQAPDLILGRAEVTSIVELRERGLTLLGPNRFQNMGIPVEIEGYRMLADQLRQWAPSGPRPSRRWDVAPLGAGIAAITLLGIAFLAPTPAVGAFASALLVILLVWAFVEIRRNTNLDRETRRSSWIIAIPVAVLVVRVAKFLIYGE